MAEPISREKFLEQLIAHVKVKFPLVKLARAEQSFSLKINGHTASLENLYRIAVLRPDEVIRHVDRWVVELLRVSEGSPDQVADFSQLKDRILPMILTDHQADLNQGQMTGQPLVGPLQVVYAVDSDRTIAYIPKAVFSKWGIDLDQLHELAVANLVARSQSINAQAAQDGTGDVNLVLFQTMDGYDASRILLPSLHERLRGHLGSPFVAGIPNRDILLCFRDDPQTVERLRKQIQADYRQMPHQVTDQLFLITADGIAMRQEKDV